MNRRLLSATFLAVLLALVPAFALAQQGEREEHGVRIDLGGTSTVHPDEVLEFLLAIDANVAIEGQVDGAVVLLGNDTIITGQVDGDVFVVGGSLHLTNSAIITGDLAYTDASISRDPEAVVMGETRSDLGAGFGQDFYRFIAWLTLANWAGTTLLLLLGALIFAGIGGRQLASSALAITTRPLQSLLAAFALLAVGTVLVIVLFFTVLGIPIAIAVMTLLAAVWLLGYIVVGTRIGSAIIRRPLDGEDARHPYLAAIVGVTILQVIAFVPVITTLVMAYADPDAGLSAARLVAFSINWSLGALLLLIGLFGTGALTYRAFQAWTTPETGEPTTAGSPR